MTDNAPNPDAALDHAFQLEREPNPVPPLVGHEMDKPWAAGPELAARPPQNQPDLPIYAASAEMRAAGHSWDDIKDYWGGLRQALKKGGYNDNVIDKYLGYRDMPGDFEAAMTYAGNQVHGLAGADPRPVPTTLAEKFAAGAHVASGGLVAARHPEAQPGSLTEDPAGWVASQAGSLTGMAPYFIGGKGTGKAAGLALATSMGAPELGPVFGEIIGDYAAGFSTEYARSIYSESVQKGYVKGGADFVQRMLTNIHAGEQGGESFAAMGAGGFIGREIQGAVAKGLISKEEGKAALLGDPATLTRLAAKLPLASTMSTVSGAALGQISAAIAQTGELPSPEEITDTAASIILLHGGSLATDLGRVKAGVLEQWSNTGMALAKIAARAEQDPAFYAKVKGGASTPVPAGSPKGVDKNGDEVAVPRKRNPDDHPTTNPTFDDAARLTFKAEGGYNAHDANGAPVIYGVNKAANPDLFANGHIPTREEAYTAMKTRYWDAIGADDLPGNERLIAFDAAYVAGVGRAKKWLDAAGGDADTFERLYKGHLDSLIASDPGKWEKYKKSWYRRIGAAMGGEIPSGEDIAPTHGSHSADLEPSQKPGEAPLDLGEVQEGPWKEFNDRALEDRQSDFDDQRTNLRQDDNVPAQYAELDRALGAAEAPTSNPERDSEAVKWAAENGRRDITRAIVDRAQTEADTARRNLLTNTREDTNPAAIAEMVTLVEERQKNAETLAKLAGIETSPASKRRAPPELTQNEKDRAHPLVKAAQTGDKVVDNVINSEVTANVIANAKVNKDYDAPWTASGSTPLSDPTVYIGKHVPDFLVTKSGKIFSTTEPLVIHENVEQHIMEALIKAGWDKNRAYAYAHWQGGEKAEHAYYRFIGIDPAEAEEAWKPVIEAGLESKGTDYPPNPYRDTGQFGEDSHGLHNENEPKPTAAEIKEAERILKPDETEGLEGFTKTGATPPKPKKVKGTQGQIKGENPLNTVSTDPEKAILSHMVQDPHVASRWEQAGWYAYKAYTQFFANDHSIRLFTQKAQAAGVVIDALNNPAYARRMADVAPVNHGIYMLERGGIEMARDPDTNEPTSGYIRVGKALKDIVGGGSFTSKAERDGFTAYAMSKWAIEKNKQGFITGFESDLPNAKAVVAKYEANSITPQYEDIVSLARREGVNIVLHDKNSASNAADMARQSPFYYRPTRSIHLMNMPDSQYETQFGKGTTKNLVIAHELGHHLAYELGIEKGLSAADLSRLSDQLVTASFRFRPGLWTKWKKSQDYFSSPQELIADALATWMQDPEARHKLSTLKDAVPDLEKVAGKMYSRDEIGTPMSRRFMDLVDWQNMSLRYLRDHGIMDNNTFLNLVADNQARIPGYRAEEDRVLAAQQRGEIGVDKGPHTVGGGKVAYNPIARFKGSEYKLANIYDGLMSEAFIRTKVGQENLANQKLRSVGIAAGLAQDVKHDAQPIRLTAQEIGRLTAKGSMKGKGAEAEDSMVIWRAMDRKANFDEVPVFVDGVRKFVRFEDPMIAPYLKGLNDRGHHVWEQILRKTTAFTRGAVIADPTFALRNVSYDILWQFLKNPTLRNPISDLVSGYKAMYTDKANGGMDGTAFDQFLLQGGAEGMLGRGMTAQSYMNEVFKNGGDFSLGNAQRNTIPSWNPIRWSQAWNRMFMGGMKVGRFKRGMEGGEAPIEAGVMSGEAAFHRAGFGGTASRTMNAAQPFYAAHLNGMEQSFRMQFGQLGGAYPKIFGHDNETINGEPFNALHFTAKALAAVTVPALGSWAAYHNEDWYKAESDYRKHHGIFFGPGGMFWFPLPPIISTIYAAIPVMIAERMSGNAHATDHIFRELGEAFIPPGSGLSSGLAAPFIEAYTGTSLYTGHAIVPMSQAHVDPLYQQTPNTSGLAIGLAKLVHGTIGAHWSPIQIDNFARGLGGNMLPAATRALDMALQKAGIEEPPLLGYSIHDWPLIGHYFQDPDKKWTQVGQDVQDRMHAREDLHTTLSGLMRQNRLDEFKALVAKTPATELAYQSYRLSKEDKMALHETGVDFHPFGQVLDAKVSTVSEPDKEDVRRLINQEKVIKEWKGAVGRVEAMHGAVTPMTEDDIRNWRTKGYTDIFTWSKAMRDTMDRLGW